MDVCRNHDLRISMVMPYKRLQKQPRIATLGVKHHHQSMPQFDDSLPNVVKPTINQTKQGTICRAMTSDDKWLWRTTISHTQAEDFYRNTLMTLPTKTKRVSFANHQLWDSDTGSEATVITCDFIKDRFATWKFWLHHHFPTICQSFPQNCPWFPWFFHSFPSLCFFLVSRIIPVFVQVAVRRDSQGGRSCGGWPSRGWAIASSNGIIGSLSWKTYTNRCKNRFIKFRYVQICWNWSNMNFIGLGTSLIKFI